MKIESSVTDDTIEEKRYYAGKRKKLISVIIVALSAFVMGVLCQRNKIIGKSLLHIRTQFVDFRNKIRSTPVSSSLTHIDLQIGYINYQKICHQRELAMQTGRTYRVHPLNEGETGARIKVGGATIPVKVSLKGGQPYHWADQKKWSFKIEVKTDTTIMGMKKFALQPPLARFFMNDWFFQKLLKFNGLLSLRSEFIKFSINGENYGLYNIEENMGKELIEHNGKREGPIIQFCQDINWGYSDAFSASGIPDWFYGSIIQPYNTGKTVNDTTLKKQFEQALKLLETYRKGMIRGDQIFDISLLARFFAIIDLLGHKHAVALSNIKFYYNPLTGLLEPIGYDCEHIHDLYQECAYWCPKGIMGMFKQLCNNKEDERAQEWTSRLFSDRKFYFHYINELQRISNDAFVSDFFSKTGSDFQLNLELLQSQYPDYSCNIREIILRNAQQIRELLNPVKYVGIWYNSFDRVSNRLCLDVVNFHPLPVVFDSVILGEEKFKCLSDNIVDCQLDSHQPARSVRLYFAVPEKSSFSDSLVSQLKVVSHIFGTENYAFEQVKPWQFCEGNVAIASVPVSLPESLPEFVYVDDDRKEIRILPGSHTLVKKLEIPRGYDVYCGNSTSIDLIDSAGICSFSPVHFVSEKDKGILIFSSDSSSKGVAVIDAVGESRFEGVTFNGLNAQNSGTRFLTGGVTVYNTRVIFDRCEFIDMRSEDALNIVRSEFSLLRTVFKNAAYDGVDIDFCKGTVSRCGFYGIRNDAVDLSGSTIKVEWLNIHKAGDKGISSGEKSRVYIENTSVCSTGIGVASKDLSEVSVCNVKISDADTALAVYQKKPEFGGGKLITRAVIMNNVGIGIYKDCQSVVKQY